MTAGGRKVLIARLAAFAVGGVLVCAAGPAQADAARHHGRRAAVSERALAQAVTHARSTPARREAVTAVMRALRVGVYTGKGRAIVRGADRGSGDVYAYDFEVKALAAGLARHDATSLNDLAARLATAGIGVNGAPLTGAVLGQVIASRTRTAIRGHASHPAVGLIARDLGLARGVDIAAPLAADKPLLDPLQTWLIAADIAAPLLHRAAARPRVALAHAASACNNNSTGRTAGDIVLGKWVAGLTPATAPLTVLNELTDLVHGVAIAYSARLFKVPTDTATAWGTNGPGSGKPIRFQVRAEMLDDLGEAINCGALAGYTVPPKGPISGVQIEWDVKSLYDQGVVTCDAACTQTQGDGVATLAFQPFDEDLGGLAGAPLITTTGAATASATMQFKNGNALGAIAERLGFQAFTAIGWSVAGHQPSGYAFDAQLSGVQWGSQDTADYDQHFTVCGPRAFAAAGADNEASPPSTPQWSATTHEHHTSDLPDFAGDPVDANGTLGGVTFTRGATTTVTVDDLADGHDYRYTLDITLLENPARARLTAHFDRANHQHLGDYTYEAPIRPAAC